MSAVYYIPSWYCTSRCGLICMPQWLKTLWNTVTHSRRVWKGLMPFWCFVLLCYMFAFQAISPSLKLEAIYVRDLFVLHSERLSEITDTPGQCCIHLEFSFFLNAGGRNCFTALRLTISQKSYLKSDNVAPLCLSFFLSLFLFLFFLFFSTLKCRCLHMIMRALVMLACLFLLLSLQTKMKLS